MARHNRGDGEKLVAGVRQTAELLAYGVLHGLWDVAGPFFTRVGYELGDLGHEKRVAFCAFKGYVFKEFEVHYETVWLDK